MIQRFKSFGPFDTVTATELKLEEYSYIYHIGIQNLKELNTIDTKIAFFDKNDNDKIESYISVCLKNKNQQWEIYSEDLKQLFFKKIILPPQQIFYIEYEEEEENH